MYYSLLAVFGYFVLVFSASMPLLRDDHGTSSTVAGVHVVAYAIGTISMGVWGDQVVRLAGRRRTLWGGLVGFAVVGIAALVLAPGPWMSIPSALLIGMTTTCLINVVIAGLSDLHGPLGTAAISEANAYAAAMGIVSPAVLGAVLAAGWDWRIATLPIVGLAVATAAVFGRVPVPDATPRDDHDEAADGTTPRAFWPTWLSMLACNSFEFCFVVWASDVLRQHAGARPSIAALGLSAVVAGVVVGRLVIARLTAYVSLPQALYGSQLVVLLGFAVFWLTTNPVVAVMGLFVSGIGIGPAYPLSVGRLIAASGHRADTAGARASLASGIAIGAGPFTIGVLGDHLGAHRAMLVVPVLVLTAALTVWWTTRLGVRVGAGRR